MFRQALAVIQPFALSMELSVTTKEQNWKSFVSPYRLQTTVLNGVLLKKKLISWQTLTITGDRMCSRIDGSLLASLGVKEFAVSNLVEYK